MTPTARCESASEAAGVALGGWLGEFFLEPLELLPGPAGTPKDLSRRLDELSAFVADLAP